MKRIALCISGQSRSWKRCYQTWIDNIGYLGEIDFFFHFWDYNTLPMSAIGYVPTKKLTDIPLTIEEKEEIVKTLKPKDFEFESYREIEVSKNVKNPVAWWTRPQFYSMKKSAFIKRKYEIANNFEYDIVFRVRSDLVLEHKIISPNVEILPNAIYTCINNHDTLYKTFRVGDTFFFGNSYSFDQVSNFYDAFDYIDAKDVVHTGEVDYPPELAFYYYMKLLGLRNISNPIHHKIARTEEYMKIKGGLDHYETL